MFFSFEIIIFKTLLKIKNTMFHYQFILHGLLMYYMNYNLKLMIKIIVINNVFL